LTQPGAGAYPALVRSEGALLQLSNNVPNARRSRCWG